MQSNGLPREATRPHQCALKSALPLIQTALDVSHVGVKPGCRDGENSGWKVEQAQLSRGRPSVWNWSRCVWGCVITSCTSLGYGMHSDGGYQPNRILSPDKTRHLRNPAGETRGGQLGPQLHSSCPTHPHRYQPSPRGCQTDQKPFASWCHSRTAHVVALCANRSATLIATSSPAQYALTRIPSPTSVGSGHDPCQVSPVSHPSTHPGISSTTTCCPVPPNDHL